MNEEEAIERARIEVGLEREHASEIRRMLRDPGLAERSCCGGFCDPCVTALRRARDRARQLLGAVGPLA